MSRRESPAPAGRIHRRPNPANEPGMPTRNTANAALRLTLSKAVRIAEWVLTRLTKPQAGPAVPRQRLGTPKGFCPTILMICVST
jgi:hypothetical protein